MAEMLRKERRRRREEYHVPPRWRFRSGDHGAKSGATWGGRFAWWERWSVARSCHRGASVRGQKWRRGSRIAGLRPSRAAYARNTRSTEEPLRAALRRAPSTATDVRARGSSTDRYLGNRDHDSVRRQKEMSGSVM